MHGNCDIEITFFNLAKHLGTTCAQVCNVLFIKQIIIDYNPFQSN